jgi:hypothetical protein
MTYTPCATVEYVRRWLRKSGWFYSYPGSSRVGPFNTREIAAQTAFYDRHYS